MQNPPMQRDATLIVMDLFEQGQNSATPIQNATRGNWGTDTETEV